MGPRPSTTAHRPVRAPSIRRGPAAAAPRTVRRPAGVELLVLDHEVEEPQVLLAAVARPCRLLRLRPGDDALAAITAALAAMRRAGRPAAALHVIGHGGPGRMRLAGCDLTAGEVERRPGAVGALARALRGAPVLLYGCRVAAGGRFVAVLSEALGAPVRAAEAAVGAAALGGSWTLAAGRGDAAGLLDPARGERWRHLLANTDVTTAGDLTLALAGSGSGDTVTLTTDGGAYAMDTASVGSITLLLGGGVTSAGITPNNAAFAIQAQNNVSATFTVQVDGGKTLTLNTRLADQGTGRLGLEKTGAGTLVLGNATAGGNTGGTAVSAGTLRVSGGSALSDASAVSVSAGATLDLNGTSETIGGLSGAGNVTLGAGTLTIDQTGSGTFSGNISGTGNVNKTGTGTLTLSGGNQLTGTITVSAGGLNATGGIDGAVSIASGAALTGTCSIAGALFVASGGTVAPGGGPGTVAAGGLTLAAGATFDAEINGTTPGTDYDQIAVTGTVNVGGATLDARIGYAPAIGDSFDLVENDGADAVVSTFAGLAEGATFVSGGRIFRISYAGDDGNDITVTRLADPPGDPPIVGTPGSDHLIGTNGSESISALTGDDVLLGLDGSDSLHGGGGVDQLFGNNGADLVYGNQGDDLLYGNPGNDTIYGGQDSDTAFGGRDADRLHGNRGGDLLVGGEGGDVLYGNQDDDILVGGPGADFLYGGRDSDTLSGGGGGDLLVGGVGADRYAFGSGSGADTVRGFSAADGDALAVPAGVNGSGIGSATDLLARVAAGAGGDAVIELGGGNTITLSGVPPGAVAAEWFLMA